MTLPSQLSEAERERLLDALQDEVGQTADLVDRWAGPGPAPASYAQRRLWFLDRLRPGDASYNVPYTARLRGRLDRAALERTLATVVDRHEPLRTVFRAQDGEPVQVVGDGAVRLDVAAPGTDPAGWVAGQTRRPFDLATGPLLRCGLLPVGPEEHLLALTAHHTVVDGWSMTLLLGELAECYQAYRDGTEPRLPALAVRYQDFAAWQRARAGGPEAERELAHWRQLLAGAPPVLELPTDPAGDPTDTAGTVVSRDLAAGTAAAVHALGRDTGTTTFMVATAATALLLGRLAGTEDVVVGFPIASRPRPELEPLVGYFVNTLPLRVDLAGGPTFRELLGRVRAATVDAYDHQDIQFEQLVEAVNPDRDTSRTPIFQVLVNHTGTVAPVRTFGDLALEPQVPVDPDAKYLLTVYVREDERTGGIGVDLLGRTATLGPDRLAVLADQLTGLLDQLAAAPATPVEQATLVTPQTAGLLPDPAVPLRRGAQPRVRELVEAWVRATPDAPAVEVAGAAWSYRELWDRAEAVRRALAGLGAGPGTVVGVTGGRSPALVATVLAVLAGDQVLVSLDPRLPRLRRRAMLAEAGVTHLVRVGDDAPTDDRPEEEGGPRVLRVDAAGTVADAPAGGDLPPVSGDVEAAYLFFTSGTTGKPKAVLGRHAGLTHFLRWQRDTFRVGPGDRCSHLTGLSFDVVLRELLLPLVSGATLCVPAAGDQLDPAALLGWLAEQRVTAVHTVPPLARAWLATRPEAGPLPAGVRLTFFAGEPLTGRLVRAWRSAVGADTVVNLYGPTETTLAKCAYVVPADPPDGVLPVGRAQPGAQALVLAGDRRCGVGEVGEIVLRTPYRSLPRPGATDVRWSVNPATGDPDDLLYRTGDRGRFRPDGMVDILGRLDRQVKIRGVRVETDEVAATLDQHPAVERVVVAARPYRQDELMLVAYVVAPGQTAGTAGQLRSYLGKRLPAAMVPGAFVFLDAIPTTPNGKTDWAALPAGTDDAAAEAEHVPPRTETERVVAGIMSELLGRDRIGAYDSFFALGGHSLLAMQLGTRITAALAVELPLQAIFEAATPAAIAAAADEARAAGPAADEPVPLGRAVR